MRAAVVCAMAILDLMLYEIALSIASWVQLCELELESRRTKRR
jgi:hypothetical protein